MVAIEKMALSNVAIEERTLFNVLVYAFGPEGDVGGPIAEYDVITMEDLFAQAFDIPEGGQLYIGGDS